MLINEHSAQVWEYVGDDGDEPMDMLDLAYEYAQRAMLEAPDIGNRTEQERKIYDALLNFSLAMEDARYNV